MTDTREDILQEIERLKRRYEGVKLEAQLYKASADTYKHEISQLKAKLKDMED